MSAQQPGRRRPKSVKFVAESRQGWRSEVAKAAATDAGGLDPGLLGDFLDRLADPAPGRAWDRHQHAAFAALGARAAEQGVALAALVDLYLSAAWRAWPRLPAVAGDDAPAMREAGRSVLRASDDVVAAVAEGFTAARRAVVLSEASARREFVDDLLSGTADPAGLLARAESYGLQLAGAHAVVLIDSDAPFREATPVLSDVAAALTGVLGDLDVLITTRDGHLVIVLPTLPADVRDRAVAAMRGAVPDDARLAVGRAYPGPSGVARSFTEAREAHSIAERIGLTDPVLRAENLLVYQVLLRDRAALTDLIETVLAPLRQARGGAGPLLDTLHAYLGSGGNTTRAAAVLHLSVRAVTYRLDRVAELTGWDPHDPEQRYVLHTAVLGARSLGWPDVADSRQ
ncbi:MAG TPA: helix-turn-helix domain-containing protein [Pseudonocardiaceae bacterium]